MSKLPPEKIAMLNEFGESEAWANYYLCAPPEFVQKYRLEAKKIGSVWVTMIAELDWTFLIVLWDWASATSQQNHC